MSAKAVAVVFTALFSLFLWFGAAHANHYTDMQLEALATRTGKTYWVVAPDGKTPSFLTAPSSRASSFHPEANAPFDLVGLVMGNSHNPYYKARFAHEQFGYVAAEAFLEGLNYSFRTSDPLADEKRRQAKATEEESRRVAWIRARPWSESVKEAALNRQAVIGMSTGEVTMVVGKPLRVVKPRGRQQGVEEQWHYADGAILIFTNGLLNRIETMPAKHK